MTSEDEMYIEQEGYGNRDDRRSFGALSEYFSNNPQNPDDPYYRGRLYNSYSRLDTPEHRRSTQRIGSLADVFTSFREQAQRRTEWATLAHPLSVSAGVEWIPSCDGSPWSPPLPVSRDELRDWFGQEITALMMLGRRSFGVVQDIPNHPELARPVSYEKEGTHSVSACYSLQVQHGQDNAARTNDRYDRRATMAILESSLGMSAAEICNSSAGRARVASYFHDAYIQLTEIDHPERGSFRCSSQSSIHHTVRILSPVLKNVHFEMRVHLPNASLRRDVSLSRSEAVVSNGMIEFQPTSADVYPFQHRWEQCIIPNDNRGRPEVNVPPGFQPPHYAGALAPARFVYPRPIDQSCVGADHALRVAAAKMGERVQRLLDRTVFSAEASSHRPRNLRSMALRQVEIQGAQVIDHLRQLFEWDARTLDPVLIDELNETAYFLNAVQSLFGAEEGSSEYYPDAADLRRTEFYRAISTPQLDEGASLSPRGDQL